MESETPRLNRLAREKSPYLRQHATNPVDWYPWGDEAFAKARSENKPVFLSIGYSSCHWCHVMEHESFADDEVAAVLNEHFVSIKVDREERPDVDEIYMLAAQLIMRGGGGWPLSVWLTPEGEPFFAGTYFPKKSRAGQPGFVDLLRRIASVWADDEGRRRIDSDGARMVELLGEVYASEEPSPLGLDQVEHAAGLAAAQVDPEQGGFGSQPKFPSPSSVEMLLRAALRDAQGPMLGHVTLTLDRMASGGIHDHIGGGFHRYSVTRDWRVPHFEKMLYDNAQLLGLYAWAHLVTGEERYAEVARGIFRWVRNEMTHPEGGFYSAQDADDPGGPEGEGGFYVWDPAEVQALFDGKQAEVVLARYGITERGNWPERPGKTILETRAGLDTVAERAGVEAAEIAALVRSARDRMYEVRETRPKPMTDTKVLAGWNGLMISGLCRAHQALGDAEMRDAAVSAGEFLLSNLAEGGRLRRRWMEGEAAHDAVLADHAYVVAALLDLYESTLDVRWLEQALAWSERTVELFYDPEQGGFFFTASDSERLIARGKPGMDNARPSGNGVMALNLLRIAELTGDPKPRERALATLRFFGARITRSALGAGAILNATDFAHAEPRQIFVAGDRDDPATRALIEAVWRSPDPNRVLALVTPDVEALLPPARNKPPVRGKPAAYICRNQACHPPLTDPQAMLSMLCCAHKSFGDK